jgi:hypothetical protein
MKVDEVIKSAFSRVGIVRVRNALNSLLWLSLICLSIAPGFAYLFRDDAILEYGFAAIAVAPILGSLIAYFVLLFRDPDRLQSEEFVLQQHAQQIIQTKGNAPESLESNPPVLRIESKPPEDEQ